MSATGQLWAAFAVIVVGYTIGFYLEHRHINKIIKRIDKELARK